jgi:transmembrane sensor
MTPGETLPFPADETQSVERIAAQWMVRQQEGLTAAEQKQLEVWLESEPRHLEVFLEIQETSQLLDQLRDPAQAGPPTPVPAHRLAFASLQHWLKPALAAAAAIVIGWFLWPRSAPGDGPFVATAVTEIGVVEELRLPDGSMVRLNTDSAVSVSFSDAERRVRLNKGEAYFSVAKNSDRPFWVEAGAVAVRTVGTAFNVRRQDHAVDVLVTEGKVKIERTSSQPGKPSPAIQSNRFLVAGQKLSIAVATNAPESSVPRVIPREQIARTLAWQQRRLEFDRMPLSEVVAEFNRHNRHQLVIADPGLAAQSFGGGFSSQGFDAFVEILEQSFGVKAERREDVTILRKAER